jgi:hypothetical protein
VPVRVSVSPLSSEFSENEERSVSVVRRGGCRAPPRARATDKKTLHLCATDMILIRCRARWRGSWHAGEGAALTSHLTRQRERDRTDYRTLSLTRDAVTVV